MLLLLGTPRNKMVLVPAFATTAPQPHSILMHASNVTMLGLTPFGGILVLVAFIFIRLVRGDLQVAGSDYF